MNSEQYSRANRITLITSTIIILATIGMVFVGATLKGFDAKTNVAVIGAVAGLILAIVGGTTKRAEKMGSLLLMGGSTISYFVVMVAPMIRCTLLWQCPFLSAPLFT